jgi:hypothetical protein
LYTTPYKIWSLLIYLYTQNIFFLLIESLKPLTNKPNETTKCGKNYRIICGKTDPGLDSLGLRKRNKKISLRQTSIINN